MCRGPHDQELRESKTDEPKMTNDGMPIQPQRPAEPRRVAQGTHFDGEALR